MKSTFTILQKFESLIQKLVLCLALIVFTVSCGNHPETKIKAPEGMHVLDLSSFGKPFAIFVPDTAKQPLSIVEEGSGALIIQSGNNFAISILEEASDLELKRNDIQTDEINKLISYLADEPKAVFWESAITEPEYHFLINAQVGDRSFSFQDVPDTDAGPFKKEAVQRMFDACKNIQALQKKE